MAKGLAKEGMGTILDEAEAALADVEWTPTGHRCRPGAAAREARPQEAHRLPGRSRGNLRQPVSPPLSDTMALIGREDCMARIARAKTMAL